MDGWGWVCEEAGAFFGEMDNYLVESCTWSVCVALGVFWVWQYEIGRESWG